MNSIEKIIKLYKNGLKVNDIIVLRILFSESNLEDEVVISSDDINHYEEANMSQDAFEESLIRLEGYGILEFNRRMNSAILKG